MARKKVRKNTKDALADALLHLLSEGVPLEKIPVHEITDACDLDRQTFYYHFRNTHELADYAYERAIAGLFGVEEFGEVADLDWKSRLTHLLTTLEADHKLRDTVIPAVGELRLRRNIIAMAHEMLTHSLAPELSEQGVSERDTENTITIIAYSLGAVVIAWIARDIDLSVSEMIDLISRLRDSFLMGLNVTS